jgi:hypothetical protein
MKKFVIILLITLTAVCLNAQSRNRDFANSTFSPFINAFIAPPSPTYFDYSSYALSRYYSYKGPIYLPGEAMLLQTLLSNFQIPDTAINYCRHNGNRLVYSDGSVSGNYLLQVGILVNTKGKAEKARLLGCFQLLPFDAVTKLNYNVVFLTDVGDGRNPRQPAISVTLPEAVQIEIEKALTIAIEKLASFLPATERTVVISSTKLVVLPFNF